MLRCHTKSIKMQLKFELNINPRKLLYVLVTIELLFLMVDGLFSCCWKDASKYLVILIGITKEGNIPTWFSSTQALAVGMLALVYAQQRKGLKPQQSATGWYVIAIFFSYLAIDDAAKLHERLATGVHDSIQSSEQNSWLTDQFLAFSSYHWQFLFIPVFGVIALYMLGFLYRVFDGWKKLIIFSSGIALYVVAVALDYVEGIDSWVIWMADNSFYLDSQITHFMRALEEFLEMFGTSLILYSFLLAGAEQGIGEGKQTT